VLQNVQVKNSFDIAAKTGKIALPARLDLDLVQSNNFSVILSNNAGEQVVIGYDNQKKEYFIDRTRSGNISFQKDFAGRHVAPRISDTDNINCSLIIDVSSVELFADNGLTGMTAIFFLGSPFNNIRIESAEGIVIKKLSYSRLRSIWP
jgi:fructan beta-fructosidase